MSGGPDENCTNIHYIAKRIMPITIRSLVSDQPCFRTAGENEADVGKNKVCRAYQGGVKGSTWRQGRLLQSAAK
jgi:hypothetical protein